MLKVTDIQKHEWPVFLRTLFEIVVTQGREADEATQGKTINHWLKDQPVPYDEDYGYCGLMVLATEEQKIEAYNIAIADRVTPEQTAEDNAAAASAVGHDDHEDKLHPPTPN